MSWLPPRISTPHHHVLFRLPKIWCVYKCVCVCVCVLYVGWIAQTLGQCILSVPPSKLERLYAQVGWDFGFLDTCTHRQQWAFCSYRQSLSVSFLIGHHRSLCQSALAACKHTGWSCTARKVCYTLQCIWPKFAH